MGGPIELMAYRGLLQSRLGQESLNHEPARLCLQYNNNLGVTLCGGAQVAQKGFHSFKPSFQPKSESSMLGIVHVLCQSECFLWKF